MDDRIRKLIRIVIVLIGIGILVYPSLSEFLMERNSSRAIAVYDDTVSKMQAEKINALFEEAESYNKRLAVSTGYEKPPVNAEGKPITPESYHSILNLENNGMMGYITIPKINETIRIFHGTEEAVLQVGAGHLESTSFLLEEQIPMPYCRDTEVCRLPIYLLTLTGWKKEMSFT